MALVFRGMHFGNHRCSPYFHAGMMRPGLRKGMSGLPREGAAEPVQVACCGPLPVRDPDKWRPSLRCRGTCPLGSRQTRSHPGTRVGETKEEGEESLAPVRDSEI